MKLYTKEMFLIAAEKCEVSMIDAKHIMKYIDEYVKPIEPPTDEEIEDSKHPENSPEQELYNDGWEDGIKWLRNKIQGGNK